MLHNRSFEGSIAAYPGRYSGLDRVGTKARLAN